MFRLNPILVLAFGLACGVGSTLAAQEQILINEGSTIRYLANLSNPGLGTTWTDESFDDQAWDTGLYGVGYEAGSSARDLITTEVPLTTSSVYTRAIFDIPDLAQISNLFVGADWDDGWIAWINGVEIYRSPQMPAGAPSWNTSPDLHESSNGSAPDYGVLVDITALAGPLLRQGANVFAAGVWNEGPTSSDLVLVPTLRANVESGLVRGPYLQLSTPDSVTIRWRTTLPEDSVVRFGSNPANLTEFVADPGLRVDHEVRISGLDPNSEYWYSVGDSVRVLAGGDLQHSFRTAPVAGSRIPVRAWVIGDAGTSDSRQRRVRDAYYGFEPQRRTDLWLMLGDNAYDSGTDQEYQSAVFDMYPELLRSSPVWPTFGNHDTRSASSSSQSGAYYDMFTLPAQGEAGGVPSGTEAYYSFDWANIHFVCLDSTDTLIGDPDTMRAWLQQDLAFNTQDWLIAYFHHPPYTKGSHDSDIEPSHILMRDDFLRELEAAGVDLVLGGHSHSYERSFLLDGHYGFSWDLTPSHILDGGDGSIGGDGYYWKPGPGTTPREGAVNVVAGSSGKTSDGPLDHPAMILGLQTLGSVVLDVNGLRLDAVFLDDQGQVLDRYTIVKGCPAPPCVESSCFDTVDDDGDGDVDCFDYDCTLLDSDGDRVPDCEDCSPFDATSSTVPPVVDRLFVEKSGQDPVSLRWPASASSQYDVLTGSLDRLRPDGGLASAMCLSRVANTNSIEDSRGPGPEFRGVWYLVRTHTPCGAGDLGPSSGPARTPPPGLCD